MAFTMEIITAFVAVDTDGEEGVMGMKMGDSWMPLIGADPVRIKALYPIALDLCNREGKEMRVLQFSNRVDVTDEWRKKLFE